MELYLLKYLQFKIIAFNYNSFLFQNKLYDVW